MTYVFVHTRLHVQYTTDTWPKTNIVLFRARLSGLILFIFIPYYNQQNVLLLQYNMIIGCYNWGKVIYVLVM